MLKFERKTLLYPSISHANEAIKAEASDSAVLGINRSTPYEFVQSQWELWGDGRSLATDAYRLMFVYSMLEKYGFDNSVGTASQISVFLGRYFHDIEKTGFSAPNLTKKEQCVFDIAKEYGVALEVDSFVELSQALPIIAPYACKQSIEFACPCSLSEPLYSFYRQTLGIRVPTCTFDGNDENLDLSVLKPMGDTVSLKMVLDELDDSARAGRKAFAIVAPDALDAYDKLAGSLSERGFAVDINGSVPFSRTAFGSFFLSACKLYVLSDYVLADEYALSRLLEVDEDSWVDVAADIANSPYAGIAPFELSALPSFSGLGANRMMSASELSAYWRSNRLLKASDAISDLSLISSGFARIHDLFNGKGDPFASFSNFSNRALSKFEGINRMKEAGAVDSLISLMNTVATMRMPITYLAIFSSRISVSVSARCISGKDSRPSASFLNIGSSRDLYPKTYEQVILTDATDAYLNSKNNASSLDYLAIKLGFNVVEDKAERSKIALSSCLEAAVSKLCCVLPQHDSESKETYSSFALNDLIDSWSGSVEESSIGEEYAVQGIGLQFNPAISKEAFNFVERGKLHDLSLSEYMRHVSCPEGDLAVISPSSMEAYLQCPYKWFLDRIVSAQCPDEGFGPIEGGNFAHKLLESFYEKAEKRFGHNRLRSILEGSNTTDIGDVVNLFRNIAQTLLQEQFEMQPGSGRYVPASPSEIQQAASLQNDVLKSIFEMVRFPSAFKIQAQELPIGSLAPGSPVIEYAGFALSGKVDRVDADVASEKFAVIDYKGSLAGHSAGESCFNVLVDEDGISIDPSSLPEHIQVLVYAKALLNLGRFGQKCDAALYASYRSGGRDAIAVGSYSASEEGYAGSSNASSQVNMNFNEFLQLVEDAVSVRLAKLLDSDISISPSCSSACDYCSYSSCGKGV